MRVLAALTAIAAIALAAPELADATSPPPARVALPMPLPDRYHPVLYPWRQLEIPFDCLVTRRAARCVFTYCWRPRPHARMVCRKRPPWMAGRRALGR